MRYLTVGLAALVLAGAADANAATRRKPKPAVRPATPAAILHISSHLAESATVLVDGAAAVTAPGYGSVETGIGAGKHVLTVTTEHGVRYTANVDLQTAILFRRGGKAYWCVNLLETEIQDYSAEECQMDVTDRG